MSYFLKRLLGDADGKQATAVKPCADCALFSGAVVSLAGGYGLYHARKAPQGRLWMGLFGTAVLGFGLYSVAEGVAILRSEPAAM